MTPPSDFGRRWFFVMGTHVDGAPPSPEGVRNNPRLVKQIWEPDGVAIAFFASSVVEPWLPDQSSVGIVVCHWPLVAHALSNALFRSIVPSRVASAPLPPTFGKGTLGIWMLMVAAFCIIKREHCFFTSLKNPPLLNRAIGH